MIKILRKFKTSIALILYFILLVPTAFAAGIGDVVTDVSNNLVTPAYDFGTEDVTGLNIQMHMASGKYGSGIGALSVVGPVDSNGMKALLTRVVDVAGQTGVKTTPLKGGEVREYSMSNGIGLTVQLPDYLITVEIYESGNSASADMQTAKILAQKLLDGLEKNGLLKQAAPKISEDSNLNKKQNQSSSNTEYKDKVLIGEPKDKGIVILNTDNTAGVSNGPTAPNIFKIDKPHLLTYIRNYHWNNGKGATPGTISLKDQNGKIYGPWQAQGTPGMGGISNANWEVSPKIILPEGTYTIIDSDPKTWSTNAQSGGRGMGQVHVTPNYTTSNNEDFSNLNKQAQETGGVGAIGNIPGPDSVTEAIVGVAVPGIIATALSALSGISTGGLGGFTPPPTGTSNIRLSSSNSVPSSQRTTSTTNISDINVLGRKRREDESFVAEDKQTIINSEVNTKIALNINDSNQTIKIDTSAFDFSEKENLDTVEIKTVEPNISKDGFNKDGFNKDGLNKDGFNKDGFNKDGFNKDGFNKDGFNKDGFNKDDLAQGKGKKTSTTTTEKPNANKEQLKENNEYDEFGYNKNGFNKDGYDRDGYDLEGFDYKGYNRSGFDPWGYNKQGYSKDGYHWTGFNKDGYNKMGRHWSENPAEGDSPFNVDTRNPFDGGPVVIGEWKPTKPALGEPYPRTLEKYGAKPWTNEPTEEKSAGQIPNDSKEHSISNTKENTSKDSDIIGPEDPMNTLKNHGINKEKHPESIPEENSINSDAVKNDDIGNDTGDNVSNTNSPKDGEKKVLTGATDGRSIEIEYNSKTGEWVNTENGNIVDPDKFEKWQTDLAEDKKRILEDIEKMSKRTDSNSKAIDENLSQWKKIEQMQKTAEKYGIGEKGGPGDVEKAIQDLKNDMLNNKSIDQEKLAKINKVIDSRIKGETIADNGERWTEVPWYKDIDSALKANTETAKNIVTGQDSEGNTSWGGIIGRTAIGLATGGSSEYIMTVAEALSRVKDGINNNESGTKATLKAIGMVIAEEGLSKVLEGVGSIGADEFARRFPVLTKKLGDAIENGLVKINAVDQELSKKLGLIKNSGVGEGSNILSKQGATANNNLVNNSKDNIPKQGADKIDDFNVSPVKDSMERTDVINTTEEKIIKLDKNDINTKNKPGELTSKNNPDTEMSKSKDTLTQQEIAVQKKIESKIEDFDKIPKEKQTEIIKKQAEYEEYKMQAEEKVWKLSDKKIKNHEDITVDDILDLKADPAAMRILKDVDKVDGIKGDLGSEGAKKIRMEFNEAIDSKVHQPSYREVEGQLSSKYGEVRLETVRTPEAKAPWDVNTDNDVVALRKVTNPDGTEEWVEIPRDEWEKLYYKAYGDRTGYSPEQAAQKFPCVDWNKLDDAGKVQKWAELHGENATDVYHPEAARDFNTQRTAILKGNAPDCATARQAALGQRELLDAEAFGMMEKYKVNHYWEKGDIVNKTEALEQLRKAGNQIKNIEQGYKNMGYKISDMPSNMEKGLDIINDRSLAPDTRAELLKSLGYDTPGDFVNKLTSRLSSLKIAKK